MMSPPVKSGPRYNELIVADKVRVIDENGENLGVMYTREAIEQAAMLLVEAFRGHSAAWPDFVSAYEEVQESFGEDRVSVRDTLEGIVIPRAAVTTSGSNFEVLIGFEVTQQMAAFNREGKRFRVTAGQQASVSDNP